MKKTDFDNITRRLESAILEMKRLQVSLSEVRPDKSKQVAGAVKIMQEWMSEIEKEQQEEDKK